MAGHLPDRDRFRVGLPVAELPPGLANRAKLVDGLAVTVLGAGGLLLSAVTEWPWLVTNFVVLGLPLAYLLARMEPHRRRFSPRFAIMFPLFALVVFDYLCERYGAWTCNTILPFKLPGGVTVEEMQWCLLYFPLVMVFNEVFFATRHIAARSPVARPVLFVGYFVAGLVVALVTPLHAVLVSYIYLKLGLLLEVGAIVLGLIINRRIAAELLKVGVIAGVFNLLFELVGLANGYWEFHGQYLGMITVGGMSFPVEEMLFIIVFSAPSIVASHAVYKNGKGW
jgi:hypothetical protein